jgi:hypothetical protein
LIDVRTSAAALSQSAVLAIAEPFLENRSVEVRTG